MQANTFFFFNSLPNSIDLSVDTGEGSQTLTFKNESRQIVLEVRKFIRGVEISYTCYQDDKLVMQEGPVIVPAQKAYTIISAIVQDYLP